jgi:hypothetical protein
LYLCAEFCVKGALYSHSQRYIHSGWLFGMCPAWVVVWMQLSGMKYFEDYLFRYSQFFCLLAWAPQLLFHICSYGIFVGCWLYSLSAACIHMCHSYYPSYLMEMLPWSSRAISVWDDVYQNVAMPMPQFRLFCYKHRWVRAWCSVYVRVLWSVDQCWTSLYTVSSVHPTACCVIMSNNTAETCVAPFDSDMHLEKVNLSGCTVFDILRL